MYTPKLEPLMVTCEKNKPGQSSEKGIPRARVKRLNRTDESLRRCLLVWASLRLVVSVLWTGVLEIKTWQYYKDLPTHLRESMYYLESTQMFAVVALILQLGEFGMLVTFICAGVKKSASLYRAYYRYCILTLIIYIIAVTLCLARYDEYSLNKLPNGQYFGEFYMTYHSNEFAGVNKNALVFGVTAILDICLEILLICLIKRLINKYSYDENIPN